MPGVPDFVEQNAQAADQTEIAAQQEEADALASAEAAIQAARDESNKVDQYFDPLYYANVILKQIGWRFDNIFEAGDLEDIKKTVAISDDEALLLTTTGKTEETADERNQGMWMKIPALLTGTEDITSHYFDSFYTKVGCCTGQTQLTLPVLERNEEGEQEKVYKTIVIDRAECTIDGVDWYDDNTTEGGYNPNCERFMIRLIAFLEKYDPTNPMLNTYGGCMANRHIDAIDPEIINDPFMLQLVDVNRSCVLSTCTQPLAYKRKQDRKSCETTFCNAEINIDDIEAGGDVSVLDTVITQQCGANSDLSKRLAGEEVPVTEPETETETTPTETIPSTPSTTTESSNFFTVLYDFFATILSSIFGTSTEGFAVSFDNQSFLNTSIVVVVVLLLLLAYFKK